MFSFRESISKAAFLKIVLVIFSITFNTDIYSQQNSSIEIAGGFAKSQESGFGTIITFSNRITGGLFLTASTGYLAFRDSKKEYDFYRFRNFDIPAAKEKFIIPLEIGGLLEFGEQKFRPFIKFNVGYNYTEYFVYEFKEYPPGASVEYQQSVESKYQTDIAASYGLGMGAYYFLKEYMRLSVNFMMHDVNNVNQYLRLMAGIVYSI